MFIYKCGTQRIQSGGRRLQADVRNESGFQALLEAYKKEMHAMNLNVTSVLTGPFHRHIPTRWRQY